MACSCSANEIVNARADFLEENELGEHDDIECDVFIPWFKKDVRRVAVIDTSSKVVAVSCKLQSLCRSCVVGGDTTEFVQVRQHHCPAQGLAR